MAAISGTTAAVISAVTAVASIAGTVVSGIAQQQAAQQQANQQKAALRYQQQMADRDRQMADRNRQIAEQNQELAEEQARASRKEGWDAAVKRRQEVAAIIGSQRARQGASGSVVDAGSSLDLNLDTTEKGEIDALALQQQGLDKARNLEMQAWSYGNEAQNQQVASQNHQLASQNYAWQASNVQGPSGLATAGTILGAVGQAGSMFGSNLWGGSTSTNKAKAAPSGSVWV